MLAKAITPYLARTNLPLPQAVRKISANYLQDGARVERLIDSQTSTEWDLVLERVISYAARQRCFPNDANATTWPDLDAYGDIQRKLASYNFEGSFDHWITVTVTNRLRRFWRDQRAKRAGGPGINAKEQRKTELGAVAASVQPSRMCSTPLDQLAEQVLAANDESVAEQVEDIELRRIVAQSLERLASQKQDTQLPQIWFALVEQRLKLHEIAARFGMTISQAYRRIARARAHLQQDAAVQYWLRVID